MQSLLRGVAHRLKHLDLIEHLWIITPVIDKFGWFLWRLHWLFGKSEIFVWRFINILFQHDYLLLLFRTILQRLLHWFFCVLDLQRWFTVLLDWKLRLHHLKRSRAEVVEVDCLLILLNDWWITKAKQGLVLVWRRLLDLELLDICLLRRTEKLQSITHCICLTFFLGLRWVIYLMILSTLT